MAKPTGITREMVVDACQALVEEGDYRSLTMRQVASKLKCSASTLYHHFRNRDDLLTALLDQVAIAIVHPEKKEDPREEVAGLFIVLRRVFLKDPWIIPIILPGDRGSVHILPLVERIFLALGSLSADQGSVMRTYRCLLRYTYGDVLTVTAEAEVQAQFGHDKPH